MVTRGVARTPIIQGLRQASPDTEQREEAKAPETTQPPIISGVVIASHPETSSDARVGDRTRTGDILIHSHACEGLNCRKYIPSDGLQLPHFPYFTWFQHQKKVRSHTFHDLPCTNPAPRKREQMVGNMDVWPGLTCPCSVSAAFVGHHLLLFR